MSDLLPKVVILGGGPSALFAWFGAIQTGYRDDEVEIWCKDKRYPPGAFWLHDTPIPATPSSVRIVLEGSPKVYSELQWGKAYATSWADYGYMYDQVAYNPHTTLLKMWGQVNWLQDFATWDQASVCQLADELDFVIQTYTLNPFLKEEIKKYQFPIYTVDGYEHGSANTCIYNGNPDRPWVRKTVAFNRFSVEYPYSWCNRLEEIKETWDQETGLSGTVYLLPDLHPETVPIDRPVLGKRKNVLLTGRFTTLNRKALSHHAQKETREFIARYQR